MRIAIPIPVKSTDEALRGMDKAEELGADIIELRPDYQEDPELYLELEKLISHCETKKIVTFRHKDEYGFFKGSEDERFKYQQKAIDLGAEFVDSELNYFRPLKIMNTKLIISNHSSKIDFHDVYRRSVEKGADIVKEVSTPKTFKEVIEMLSFVYSAEKDTIGLCMGTEGVITDNNITELLNTFKDKVNVPEELWKNINVLKGMNYSGLVRVLSPVFGGYLTFASLDKGKASAPGQLTVDELKQTWKLLQIQ